MLHHAVGQVQEVIREHPMGFGHGYTPQECQTMAPRLVAQVGVTTRGRDVRAPWDAQHTPRFHVVPAIRIPMGNEFFYETNSNFYNAGEYGDMEVHACRPVSWYMATRPFFLLDRTNIERADDIIYVSTWKHVYPPLALPSNIRQERAYYESDRSDLDYRRNLEYYHAWMLVRDDSTDNWETDRATFVLMDPNRRGRNTYAGPPSRNPHPIPYFTMPVPAHCHKMLEDCEGGEVDKRLLRDGRMSFHYFHPMVSEILMYPEVPPPPSGRESLEWYQISHM